MGKRLTFIVADAVFDTGKLSPNFITMSGVEGEAASSAAPYGVLTVGKEYVCVKSWGIPILGFKITFGESSVMKRDPYAGIHFRAEQNTGKHLRGISTWKLGVSNAAKPLDAEQFARCARLVIEHIPDGCIVLMSNDAYTKIETNPALQDLSVSVQYVAGELVTG